MPTAPASLRVEEALEEIDHLRDDVEEWLRRAAGYGATGQYQTQLETLGEVILPVLGETRRGVDGLPAGLPGDRVYEECRRAERRAAFLRRLWRWYAVRFDQRDDRIDPATAGALRAADEATWSCWASAWRAAVGAPPGPAPLPYLDGQFSAWTTPRVDVPADLRAPADRRLADQVRAMPVALIGLPQRVVWRPWWLVLLAHETGHQAQYDLPGGLVDAVRDAVERAAGGAGADPDERGRWSRWSRELFADAFAAVMVGAPAGWALRELEYGAGDAGLISMAPGYPPPLIRLMVTDALLGGGAAGTSPLGAASPPGADAVSGAARDVGRLALRVPAVASALLGVSLGAVRLGELGGAAVPRGRMVARWRDALLAEPEPVPVATLDAARLCVAGGVAAWQSLAGSGGSDLGYRRERLARRLLDTVPRCRVDGTRAASPRPATIGAAVDSLRRAVRDIGPDGEPAGADGESLGVDGGTGAAR